MRQHFLNLYYYYQDIYMYTYLQYEYEYECTNIHIQKSKTPHAHAHAHMRYIYHPFVIDYSHIYIIRMFHMTNISDRLGWPSHHTASAEFYTQT